MTAFRRPNVRWLILVTFIITIGLIMGLWLDQKVGLREARPTSNSNHISDQTLGLSFSITKDFHRIDAQTLQSQNPHFLYGFGPSGVVGVECIVSQTNLTKSGHVTIKYLQQGTYDQVKKSYPDAKLKSSQSITAGRYPGVVLDLNYTDNNVAVNRLELVTTTPSITTFAYCYSPQALASFYRPQFTSFLDSVKISN